MFALLAGLYPVKVEQMSNFIGGRNGQHRNKGSVSFNLTTDAEWTELDGPLMLRKV